MTDVLELGLLDGFERALINNRLKLVYQPKVSLKTGKLVRVEALVRWHDEKFGAVPPSRFVPLAERHGLIDPLTRWGLDTAFAQWRRWCDAGIDTGLAFNISAMSLEALDFPDLVTAKCAEHGVPSDHLVLELTEGATQPLANLMDTLTRFRIKGIGLAIDDFGTGYSALMQLRQLPFTEVKIDRFFVADSPDHRDSAAIVRAIIGLAHEIGLSTTAEGVETDAQLKLLAAMDCDIVQGYRIARPLPPGELAEWIDWWANDWQRLGIAP
ncbi:EAL domain-containing protein [Sphingomicrobium aestuariivivum]|uniref:EAL domain-containing protein n=1 Tax=Sphingomicrobium aestuariivivum TaxID=1582356 RepID=UPI001FD6C0DF|nr:EAL domain-containing protein [Sphingomicrobium aestuariivivum]MCJ8191985.1 EAL domain-containing protein [Sphingomicrobium aestuariivivum]